MFDCKEVAVPPDWDEPLPSDIALKLSGSETPTVLFSSRSEGREPSDHPIIFTGKIKRAHEHLPRRGVVTGAIRDDWGTEIFGITDPEGNVIEICNEPPTASVVAPPDRREETRRPRHSRWRDAGYRGCRRTCREPLGDFGAPSGRSGRISRCPRAPSFQPQYR